MLAGAVNIGGDHVLYGRYWGAFEEHPFLHFATCYYHGIEECILHKNRSFEPGAGGEHKRPRGFNPTKTRSVHLIRDPRLARAVGLPEADIRAVYWQLVALARNAQIREQHLSLPTPG